MASPLTAPGDYTDDKNWDAENKAMAAEGPTARTAAKTDARIDERAKKASVLADRGQGVVADTEKALRAKDDLEASVPMPKFEQVPPPKISESDPTKIWGSMAMLAAGLGSLKSRNHLNTALNSASEVLKAYHQNDQAAADQAMKSWQASNANAVKQMKFEQDTYKSILGKLDKSEQRTLGLGTLKEREVRAELTAAHSQFQDTTGAQILQQRGLDAFQKHVDHMEAVTQKSEAAADKLTAKYDQAGTFKKVWDHVAQAPDFQSMSGLDKLKAYYTLQKKFAPDHDTRGDGSPKDMAAAKAAWNAQYMIGGHIGSSKAPSFEDFYKNQWKTFGGKPAAQSGELEPTDISARGAAARGGAGNDNLPKHDLFEDPAGGKEAGGVVRVNTPEEAAKLKPGTRYTTPDGSVHER